MSHNAYVTLYYSTADSIADTYCHWKVASEAQVTRTREAGMQSTEP